MLTTSFTNGIYKFTDGELISPSVPMDNLYLTMVKWLTIGTGEHSLFTDGIFIFPSVRIDTDGRNNFTKLTVGVLATVLDNPPVFASSIKVVSAQHSYNTRFASRQNLSRPKARTNYGIQTFKFISSQIWESISPEIKRSNSMSIFKIRYTQFLIISQTHLF